MSKLGIKPVETGLAMNAMYDDGLIITQEQLKPNIDGTRQNVETAFADSFSLSLSIAYPTSDNMAALLQIAHREAYALAMTAEIPNRETIEDLIRKAHAEMLSLSSRLSSLEEKTVPSEKSEKS